MKNTQISSVMLLLSAVLFTQPLHAQEALTDYAGYFSSETGVGIYGYSNADRLQIDELAPGVYGQSSKGVGVYGRGDTSNGYSFNNEGGYFEGGKGIYARGTDSAGEQGYGARIYSTNYRGMYVLGGATFYDAYFGGETGISVGAIVDRASSAQSLVVNLGEAPIEPGDLVAMVGITSSPDNGQPMLGVAKLDVNNQNAVIGVAKQAIANKTVTSEDGSEYVDFGPTTGVSGPKSYLVIVTGGLAPAVNLSSLALVAKGKIGDKIALAGQVDGKMTLALNSNLSRSPYQEDAIVIGKMAGAVDEANGTIPMFIDID